MTAMTDPARELVDLCLSLSKSTNKRGDKFLSESFGVDAWSPEFFQIIFAISQRIEYVRSLVLTLNMDEDIKEDAIRHLSTIRQAFSPNGLNNQWDHAVKSFIDPVNVQPIKMLSSEIRKICPYPKLDDAERTELLEQVGELRSWLENFQLKEQDFIRAALLEGIKEFEFRLARLQWLGVGYTLQSLREVIAAYMALERGAPDLSAAPDADAILRKVKSITLKLFEKLNFAKDVVDTGDFVLKAYLVTTTYLAAPTVVSGLLSHLK